MSEQAACGRRAPGEVWREDDGVHIDVRGLPPPEPLVRIIRQIELAADPLIVHHECNPLLLHVELAHRGWTARRLQGDGIDASEVRLKLQPTR